MRAAPNIPLLTQQRQALAAQPDLSAWVSANAGSGKTHVLVNRVLRLLLAGVAPGRMLCITYTKAAAANMANRVFKALAEWAVLPDTTLSGVLQKLSGRPASPEALAAARRLFAQALETPGGLKIETIHAFCTRVLQAAPFEANVPPRFEVADDAAQAELMREARRELLARAAAVPQGEEAQALDLLARQAAQDTFDAMMQEALRQRALFSDADGRARGAPEMRKTIGAALDVAAELRGEDVHVRFRTELAALPGLNGLLDALAAGSATRQGLCATLRQIVGPRFEGDAVALCRAGFITAEGTINANVRGRGKSEFAPGLMAVLDALAACLLGAIDDLNAIAIRDRSQALALLVTGVLASYQRLKSRRGLMDYDDLIGKTRSLLSRVDAAWVLYKLDAGIDHILLDEAQDTSASQWAILGTLADEFAAAEKAGALMGRLRTIFVVGDEKQSIYGFQGAAPHAFGEERRRLGLKLDEAGARFEEVSLNTSFRSAPEIMRAVDSVFALPEHARGLVFDGAERPETHATVRDRDTGAVDLWPVESDDAGEPPDAWTTPVDAPERRSGTVKLAARIARVLRRWHHTRRDDLGRPFSPGDVMILLRQRGALFETIVKALKDAGVPVTGRDRLSLATHPAVEDLIALGRAVLLPDDDLTFAIALKTPLLDLDDDDLMRLAPERTGSLRQALEQAAATGPRYAEALRRLDNWTHEAGRCGPARFFADLLGPGGGRNLALARLGAEAGDALDAFLSAAFDYEHRYGPSLAGFLRHISGSAADVKRDLSRAGGEVRVMTVHGAKGLEAKIVILADIAPEPGAKRLPKILAITQKGAMAAPIWPPAAAEDCAATRAAKAQVIDQMVEEHHRLLYVAMTRAEDRLIVCGTQGNGEAPEGSWYAMIAAGLAAAEPAPVEASSPDGEGTIRRFMQGAATAGDDEALPSVAPVLVEPGWLRLRAPAEHESLPPLRPSSALSAADGAERPVDGPFLAAAAAAGRLAHKLLQILPEMAPAGRAEAARAIAGLRGAELSKQRREQIVTQALTLIEEPALAALFAVGSLAEAPVAGEIVLPDGSRRAVSGQIDRLAVTPDAVIIADFKTAARPPADAAGIPATTLAQLAVYRALLAQIYPGRTIRALAIYTATLTPLEPTPAVLDAALAQMAG